MYSKNQPSFWCFRGLLLSIKWNCSFQWLGNIIQWSSLFSFKILQLKKKVEFKKLPLLISKVDKVTEHM